ncbi:MAG TPA: nucleotidyltransferase family protein, partial [Chthoniobacterales bacterium]
AGCDPVAVVVGANLENVAAALRGLAVLIVPNEDWERGLGTSIRAGVVRLQESDAVILLVCDQPKVDAGLLRNLIARQEQTGQPMVASRYAATNGVPALFTRACFERLLALEDDSGAKALLQSRPAEVATVAFPAAAFDVDTPADFHLLGH